MQAKKILLIQLRQLGDILLTSPCITALKKDNPQHHIAFLCHRMGVPLLGDQPTLDALYTYHEKDSLRQKWNLLQTLRREQFDYVFDFMNNPRSSLFAWWTRSINRYAFSSARSLAYTHTIPRSSAESYIVEEKFSLLRSAHFSAGSEDLLCPKISPTDQTAVETLLSRQDFREAKLRVILSPTHRRRARSWPHDRYLSLAAYLHQKWGACVLWAWGPGEEEEIDQLISQCQTPSSKLPRTSIRELCAVMRHCDLFIGNSNGPSHLAVASSLCSLQLHGPTNSLSWCPMNSRHQAIQGVSMDAISLEQVQKKLEDPSFLRVFSERGSITTRERRS
ncbi:MAG: glycosyltransferase family 9 protein [Oligoflexales bacterium]|nr:glycosyltransferase family 9 protein [Oligoflexales bacterium]